MLFRSGGSRATRKTSDSAKMGHRKSCDEREGTGFISCARTPSLGGRPSKSAPSGAVLGACADGLAPASAPLFRQVLRAVARLRPVPGGGVKEWVLRPASHGGEGGWGGGGGVEGMLRGTYLPVLRVCRGGALRPPPARGGDGQGASGVVGAGVRVQGHGGGGVGVPAPHKGALEEEGVSTAAPWIASLSSNHESTDSCLNHKITRHATRLRAPFFFAHPQYALHAVSGRPLFGLGRPCRGLHSLKTVGRGWTTGGAGAAGFGAKTLEHHTQSVLMKK